MIKLVKNVFYKEAETRKKLCRFIEKNGALSFGKECEKFEKNFAAWQGRKFSIFFNSGSSANLALLQALLNLGRIKKGDEVAFSSLTWATNVMPVIEFGMEAVPVDVELQTLNVSSRTFLDAVEKHNIKVFFITNLLGFCDDLDEIKKICDKKGIILLEDNCEALGSVYKKKKLGNFGLASTFSFYVAHHLSTIEGGMVATDDSELSTMLKIVRAHGWDRNLNSEETSKIRNRFGVISSLYAKYTFYDLGFNFRPTEINGFLGNNQLSYLNQTVKKREKNFKNLAVVIYKRDDLYLPIKWNHMDTVSNFSFPIICKTEAARDLLIQKCVNKVELRPIVGGDMTKQPFFKKYQKNENAKMPNADLIHKQGMYFGNNPDLSKEDFKIITSIFG